MIRALLTSIAILVSGYAVAQDVFVDEGACPGEGCVYGERWVARKSLQLYSDPSSTADVSGEVVEGEAVQTVSGEVHTIPGRFIIYRTHGEFVPGDEVLLYTYLGEGWFRLRHNGQLKVADLGTSPWNRVLGQGCKKEPNCWGSLQSKLVFHWWVKLQTTEGLEGWVLDTPAFDKPIDH